MKYQTTKRLYEVQYKIKKEHGENYNSSIVTTIHDKDIEKIKEDLKTKYGEESWFYDPYEYYFHKVVLPKIINSNSWIVRECHSRELMEVA
jgi:hypothetical protein